MKIYRLSEVIGKKFVIDRNPFGLVNDMGSLICDIKFKVVDVNGRDLRAMYGREEQYVPKFAVFFPRTIVSSIDDDRKRFSFMIVKDSLKTYRER